MDIEQGDEVAGSARSRGAASAYADDSTRETKKWLGYGALIFLLVLMGKNMLFKDYRQETKEFLLEGGKDATEVEAYVPKSRDEVLAEIKRKNDMILTIPYLEGNVTELTARLEKLEKIVNTPHS